MHQCYHYWIYSCTVVVSGCIFVFTMLLCARAFAHFLDEHSVIWGKFSRLAEYDIEGATCSQFVLLVLRYCSKLVLISWLHKSSKIWASVTRRHRRSSERLKLWKWIGNGENSLYSLLLSPVLCTAFEGKQFGGKNGTEDQWSAV